MKLFEVIKPVPVRLLTEGYTFSQNADGKFVLGYDSSTPGQNDEIMTKRMSGLKSKKVGNRIKIEAPRNVGTGNFDVFSRKEQDEFRPHYNKDTFQTSVPTFYGMSLDPGGSRSAEREQYNRILDALKGRNGHSTTPEAMEQMLQQSAKSVMRQIEGSNFRDMERSDNIIIIPIPSSSELPGKFANAISSELGARGKVASVHDILEQNLDYKMGIAGGKDMNPDKLVNLYKNLIDEYQSGGRSEEQVLAFIERAQAFLDKKINDPQTPEQDVKLYQADLAFLQKTEEQFYDVAGQPVSDDAKQRKVHSLHGGIRRHIYDRVKIKKGAKAPKRTNNTIYVLADDNVDQGRTIIDVYRYLYKAGLFNQPGTKVIGAVMHKLGADNKR